MRTECNVQTELLQMRPSGKRYFAGKPHSFLVFGVALEVARLGALRLVAQ